MAVVDLPPVEPLAVSCKAAGQMLGGLGEDLVRQLVHEGHLVRVPHTGTRIVIPVRSIEALVESAFPSSSESPAAAGPHRPPPAEQLRPSVVVGVASDEEAAAAVTAAASSSSLVGVPAPAGR